MEIIVPEVMEIINGISEEPQGLFAEVFYKSNMLVSFVIK